ncbi:FAD-dependent monooxygenase [Kribbella koreensis]|uniref:FAD-dependent monooxygenase n=1 Tax=Kribbella koreensis TaxID=57909 RepID=A0ABP4ADW9_9ACTN
MTDDAQVERARGDAPDGVLVIGAGPTGLLLAAELSLAGIPVTLADKATERSGQSRALSLQPRSVEILHSRGLLQPLLDDAVDQVPAGHFAGLPVTLDYSSWDTRFPYQLGIPQARIEQHLENHLAARGIAVRRGLELTGLTQDAAGVEASFADGTTMRTGWLIGCDGGRSAVRKLTAIDFPGRDGRMSAVVADVVLDDQRAESSGRWQLPSLVPRDGAVLTLIPLGHGVHRVLFTGPEQQLLVREDPIGFDEVSEALTNWYGAKVVLREIRWASRFTDAVRQADRYRAGRVFLAGDAAHIHSPTGGQGMNLGLQDAFNLGWKLAAYLNGEAPEELLDSYHDERHPVAAAVLANTRAQGVLMIPDDDIACLRETFLDLLRIPEANHRLAGVISGLGIAYAPGDHPLIGRRMPDLELGDGTTIAGLLAAGRPLLLELEGFAAARVLVRPDGYVAWATDDPEGQPDTDSSNASAVWSMASSSRSRTASSAAR